MKILQVSTADLGGGAENIAWNLFKRYQSLGHQSWMAVGYKTSSDDNVFELPNNACRNWWARAWLSGDSYFKQRQNHNSAAWMLRRVFASVGDPGRGLEYWRGREDFRYPGTSKVLDLSPVRPDIVHCHNLHGNYFDLRLLPSISAAVPVVLTLHDSWLMTGHCAHSFACDKWISGCGQCPDLTIYPAIQRDATSDNWERKRRLYSESRLWIAAPSRWLIERVEKSILKGAAAEMRVIPNGIDLERFRPGDRLAARSELGLPPNADILLFPTVRSPKTQMWGDPNTLKAALERVAQERRDKPLMAITVGGEAATPERFGSIEVVNIPYTRDSAKLARIYQAADIYIHASRADTFPTMVIEAQACGLPVVASAVGGIPEQIVDGNTGFLVPPMDAERMAAAVNRLLCDTAMKLKIGREAAERAHRVYGLQQQTRTYLDWYSEIIGQFSPLKTVMAGAEETR